MSEIGGHSMKKRDFLAGFCCGAFIARASGLDLSKAYQFFAVSLVVVALMSVWEWIKNTISGDTDRSIILRRLQEHTENVVIQKNK
jgi:hypothetical protein